MAPLHPELLNTADIKAGKRLAEIKLDAVENIIVEYWLHRVKGGDAKKKMLWDDTTDLAQAIGVIMQLMHRINDT